MDIICKDISKSFGEKKVLDRFSFIFPEGKITAIMGESGVGKTTLFRILLGLEKSDKGSIEGLSGKKISVLFQEDRLFPQLTALQNAEIAGSSGKKALSLLGLAGEEDSLPENLSGGMQRRVSMARLLCHNGDLFLMDEPFKGLDEETKKKTMDVFKSLSPPKTIIFITHDQQEADFLADTVLQLK